ncbi:1-aminocyclopropane-1-carboxylate oxidase-like [Heracleum sosnowskyi]|uniref:1-aminocyclopropane-1-carboxylate oxidase-like n=1 Tax=Heracleum sosnowskyi TaxID=360622 RepID=A0AAD8N471_9APIA|nr:1-aminocyclopropane-1-carboxylate oxidase-like [Heracleum sosnowskyi]
MDGLDIKASLVSSVREKELKAFDDTKSGVKGLVDAGILNVPEMFIRPPDKLSEEVDYSRTHLQVPVIDFQGIENSDRRKQIVSQVQHASEHWGFFQVVNHGIPLSVLEGMIDGVRLFHEHDFEAKKQLYSLDPKKKVRFFSNYDLYQSQAANWMDTLLLTMLPSDQVTADDLPKSCGSTTMEYKRHILEFGDTIIELLSEALGLRANHLKAMDCAKGYHSVAGHYYPPCPQPELTSGVSKHSDSSFFTILLQDHIGGLQVLQGDKWADVEPIAGGLVVNIGDSLQIVSNDKFKSVIHRSLVNRDNARISAPYFFQGSTSQSMKYAPIDDLISEKYPRIYKSFQVSDYMEKFYTKPLGGQELRDLFKI